MPPTVTASSMALVCPVLSHDATMVTPSASCRLLARGSDYLMDEHGLQQKDLAPLSDTPSIGSEAPSGKHHIIGDVCSPGSRPEAAESALAKARRPLADGDHGLREDPEGLATVAILGATLAGPFFGRRVRARLTALRRDEARFRAIAHHAADVAAVVTEGGSIHYASPAPQGLLGRAPEDLEGTDLYALVHPDDVARARAALGTAAASGRADEALIRPRHGDGSWRAVDLVTTDHRGDPAVGGLIVVGRDLTMRAEMEAALRRSHDDLAALNRRLTHGRAVLQALFDGLDDGLLLLDHAGRVQVDNRAPAALLLGDAPDALHGRPWTEIARRLSPDAPAALAVPAPGERSQHRLRYQAPDGAIRVMDVSIAVADGTAPLPDGALPADAARVIVRVADATEAVQMQERAPAICAAPATRA